MVKRFGAKLATDLLGHHCARLPALCRARHRRQLLDNLLPRRPGDEPGHGYSCCAADHNSDELGR